MPTFLDFLIVGCGGALGAMSRFAVRNIGVFDDNPYYYTVAVNISGCLIIGIIGALFNYWRVNPMWNYLCIVGILGGYTTYSAFTFDAMELIQVGLWGRALFYISVTFFGGLGACALGLFGTERLLKLI